MERLTHRLILVVAVLAVVLPFASRAVYLDEHIFIHIARSAQTNWMFPADTPGVFFGIPKANFADHTHPPVVEYYLAGLIALLGSFSEVPFRLAFSVFPIACVLGFYSLAKRFTAQPLLVSLLFTACPAFFVYAPTLMMDIPMLAFLLVGMALYFEHTRGRRGCLAAASLCFVLAAGTGYTALVPLGCLFLALLAANRPRVELAAVAAAPAVLAIWLVMISIHFGSFPLAGTVEFFATQSSPASNAIAGLSFLGGVILFPWVLPAPGSWIIRSSIVAALIALLLPMPSAADRVWYAVLAAFGSVLLLSFAGAARRIITSGKNNGEALLILWVPATLAFFVLVADMMNARYILLLVPPLLLVLFRETSQRQLTYMLLPTAMLSIVVAYADLRFVNSYRDFVAERIAPLWKDGFKIWSAAESGPRFYLEETGARTLTRFDIEPEPLDIVVQSTGRFRYGLAEPLAVLLTPLKTFTLTDDFPVRTFSENAGAGFHDSRMGWVPYTISRAPFDAIEVAQVSPLKGAVWSPKGPELKQMDSVLVFPMKVPPQTTIEYELDGDGSVEVTADGLRLSRGPQPVIVWRNFRVVPKQFSIQ